MFIVQGMLTNFFLGGEMGEISPHSKFFQVQRPKFCGEIGFQRDLAMELGKFCVMQLYHDI